MNDLNANRKSRAISENKKELGEDKGWCPYFMTRHLLNHATIVVYNYQYMLDPKVKLELTIIISIKRYQQKQSN